MSTTKRPRSLEPATTDVVGLAGQQVVVLHAVDLDGDQPGVEVVVEVPNTVRAADDFAGGWGWAGRRVAGPGRSRAPAATARRRPRRRSSRGSAVAWAGSARASTTGDELGQAAAAAAGLRQRARRWCAVVRVGCSRGHLDDGSGQRMAARSPLGRCRTARVPGLVHPNGDQRVREVDPPHARAARRPGPSTRQIAHAARRPRPPTTRASTASGPACSTPAQARCRR